MWHPSEEDLVLHYYGEGKPADERRVDEHVASCSTCRQAWAELKDTLRLVDAAAVPEPGEHFERVMWARVSGALPEPQPVARRWQWMPALGMAAAIVVSVAVGYLWRANHEPRVVTSAVSAGRAPATNAVPVNASATDLQKTRERVLLTALSGHFQQTELLLTELMNSPDSGADLDFERATAGDLVASGRLYRVTAQQNGDLQLAQMLDDLESVLVEVARSPQKVDRKDFQSLRTRIDDQDLLFKVRAVSQSIHERQKSLISSE